MVMVACLQGVDGLNPAELPGLRATAHHLGDTTMSKRLVSIPLNYRAFVRLRADNHGEGGILARLNPAELPGLRATLGSSMSIVRSGEPVSIPLNYRAFVRRLARSARPSAPRACLNPAELPGLRATSTNTLNLSTGETRSQSR